MRVDLTMHHIGRDDVQGCKFRKSIEEYAKYDTEHEDKMGILLTY